MSELPSSLSLRRPLVVGFISLLLLACLAGTAYWWWTRPRPVDMSAVMEVNNHGVGFMEQFDYKKAVPEFEKVVQMAPEWQPGHINLAIALLNLNTNESRARARQIFQDILRTDPDNLHANFCLGILNLYEKDQQVAINYFEKVVRVDPNDAHAWAWLGYLQGSDPKKQAECYRKALALDPYLISALNAVQLAEHREENDEAQKKLIDRMEKLKAADWGSNNDIKYLQMGRYARVIAHPENLRREPPSSPLPHFQRKDNFTVHLAEGARWARASDFGTTDVGKLRAAVRKRFGATLVVLDYNRDGKLDLFLVGAVVDKDRVRNLLLRNDGDGSFTDVTAAAHLDFDHPTLGCTVADFDSDGYADLFLTGAGSQRLLRNDGKGGFEDVTAKSTAKAKTGAGLTDLKSVCLGSFFVDIDQDADLDLLVTEYAATPADALRLLLGEGGQPSGRLRLYLHAGQALPYRKGEQPRPLGIRFEQSNDLPPEKPASCVALTASDLDGDHDLDFLLLADGVPPRAIVNDRLLQFHRQDLSPTLAPPASWNGGLVLDANHDGLSDLFLLRAGKAPLLLLDEMSKPTADLAESFAAGICDCPPLLQAVVVDVNLDSWADVVGLSAQHRPVLLKNEVGRLTWHKEAFGPDGNWPKDLIAVATLESEKHCAPNLLVWSEEKGLHLYENAGNGNHGLFVQLMGHNMVENQNRLRSNRDGIGTWTIAQAHEAWVGQENTTLAAGLGQSRRPLLLGLNRYNKADVLRLHWPDLTWQAELDLAACKILAIEESNRRAGSCPILFTWDGQRYTFITDFLGAGSMGESGPDRSTRPPRPEESVKIEPGLLRPRDGHYVLKITEPMSEVTYLDHAELLVIDHPAGVRVYPDERFDPTGPPSQDLIAFRDEVFPVRARDHHGRDVTATLRRWDRNTVDDFARRSWTGFAEEHFVELDFGDRLAHLGPGERLFLCLAGWTDYAYPDSIWAAHQAGVEMLPPLLERQDAGGRWRVVKQAGFPAGLPRMMLLEVTGQVGRPGCKLRLRTNLHVYWDQIFVAAGCRKVPVEGGAQDAVQARRLLVTDADLAQCGIQREVSPDGKEPKLYAHDQYEKVPLARPAGYLTRYGEVTELVGARDDRFVIFGPGDELTVRFDARKLPPLPPGRKRSFVLRTAGYCKDAAPFTATGATVEPLPFRAMSKYPYGRDEHYPDDALHRTYCERYNTRRVGPVYQPAR